MILLALAVVAAPALIQVGRGVSKPIVEKSGASAAHLSDRRDTPVGSQFSAALNPGEGFTGTGLPAVDRPTSRESLFQARMEQRFGGNSARGTWFESASAAVVGDGRGDRIDMPDGAIGLPVYRNTQPANLDTWWSNGHSASAESDKRARAREEYAETGQSRIRTADGGDFHRLGVNRFANETWTETGRRIHALEILDGQVFMAYGDTEANTGPTVLVSYNQTSGQMEPHGASNTEALHFFRVLSGQLMAPAIDRYFTSDFLRGSPSQGFADFQVVNSTHVFDMVEYQGDLYLAGSQGRNGMVWRSRDGGFTWETIFETEPSNTDESDFSRIYGLGMIRGELVWQVSDARTGMRDKTHRYDGSSMRLGSPLLESGSFHRMIKTTSWNGGLVFRNYIGLGSVLFRGDDGRRENSVIASSRDFYVDGDDLYLLSAEADVLKTRDGRSFEHIAKAPSTASSLAVDVEKGIVYAGTSRSELFAFEMDHEPAVEQGLLHGIKRRVENAVLAVQRLFEH